MATRAVREGAANGHRQQLPSMYHVCCECSANGAILKCSCHAAYYCGSACQQAHYAEHKYKCTDRLRKDIDKKQKVVERMKTQGSDAIASVELMLLEQELAQVHFKMARLIMEKLQVATFDEAETHCKQALHLHRNVEASRVTLRGDAARAAAGKLADKAARSGLFETLINLGEIYNLRHKNDDALQVYQEALEEVRSDIAHASTPLLQTYLWSSLAAIGGTYVKQHNRRMLDGVKGDKHKCVAAIALLEEALGILHINQQDGPVAQVLKVLVLAYNNLEFFDKARSTLKESLALNFGPRYYGEESAQMAAYHQQFAFVCERQAKTIRSQLCMHMEYMLTNLMSCYHSPGSRVLVEGLQKKPQYNGCEGVVVKMNGLRMRVCLDVHDKQEMMLKPENVCPLFPTAEKLQGQMLKLQKLVLEQMTSSKECHRIQIKVTGAKHTNTIITIQTLAHAYFSTNKPVETGLALELLIQADKINRRMGVDDQDEVQLSRALSEVQAAQAQFDKGGVLSAVPCCWHPTSQQEDEMYMAQLFAVLQERNGKRGSQSMSSEAMQQGLRLYGLFNITTVACDAVSGP